MPGAAYEVVNLEIASFVIVELISFPMMRKGTSGVKGLHFVQNNSMTKLIR